MTASVLSLRASPCERLDMSGIDPSAFAASTPAEIAGLPIGMARGGPLLGDLFDIRIGDEAALVIEGGSPRLDGLGQGLEAGTIRVVGDVGQLAGRGMTGGHLDIEGGAGPLAGSGMAGGSIRIGGDAGDRLGGPMPGEMAGMRGGQIVVRGDAGARAGDRMRRGTIIVAGSAAAYAGSRMIAGTLVVGGACGAGVGQLMRRGTIVLAAAPASVPASFVDNGVAEILFLRLLSRLVPDMPALPSSLRRLAGDMTTIGKGEILLPIA
ncbi:formylmethanofuran dehydrogenase subunit C [Aureimonas altamirensis]|uniref:formylmethanofuran dehydrogenase subunit C n=1 Tax=Aureimonas altamirensis TaxID=370622 RepID=UPI002036B72F|nr:formylmethanofuran dehydrogenase subunit C [Aureimonas altamirensis]MCM2502216.1 formylmethanofuran dehydrogenase subunit C [Aureimonas altamirensis]